MTTKYIPKERPLTIEGTVEITIEKQERTKDKEYVEQRATAVKKESKTNNNETFPNWSKTFGKQNVTYMKQMQSSKSIRDIENKGTKKKLLISQQQKKKETPMHHNRHTNATPTRRISSQKNPEANLKTSCCGKSFSVNNIQSIMVQDRAVQCKMYDCSVGKIGDYNNLEISPETIATRFALEKQMFKLMESNEIIKTIFDSWSLEQETLKSKIEKQDALLREADKNQASLQQDRAKMLTQLEEVVKTIKAKDETISKLNQQITNNKEETEKIISDLRAAEQRELERNLRIKFLTMENEKLLTLLFCKDTLITDYKDIKDELIRSLQDTTKQLVTLIEAHANGGNVNSDFSIIPTGLVSSSPNSSSSDHFNNPRNELSNTSLSTVDHVHQEHVNQKKDAAAIDSMRFVSLLDGDSSHNLMPDTYKSQVTDEGKTCLAQYRNKDTIRHANDRDKKNNAKKRLNGSNEMFYRDSSSKILGSTTPEPERLAQDILNDIQNRIPVDVPSSLRENPHPDWSDSSLSSISTPSDLDTVPSNDV